MNFAAAKQKTSWLFGRTLGIVLSLSVLPESQLLADASACARSGFVDGPLPGPGSG